MKLKTKNDQDLIFEAYTRKLNEFTDKKPEDSTYDDGSFYGVNLPSLNLEDDESNIFEKLEELVRKKPEYAADLNPIIADFDKIMKYIVALPGEGPKNMIDPMGLGFGLEKLSHHSVI